MFINDVTLTFVEAPKHDRTLVCPLLQELSLRVWIPAGERQFNKFRRRNGVCFNRLKLSVIDVIVRIRSFNGDGWDYNFLGRTIILLTLFVQNYIFGLRYKEGNTLHCVAKQMLQVSWPKWKLCLAWKRCYCIYLLVNIIMCKSVTGCQGGRNGLYYVSMKRTQNKSNLVQWRLRTSPWGHKQPIIKFTLNVPFLYNICHETIQAQWVNMFLFCIAWVFWY